MTQIRFDGRVAVVTGAGQGLGRAYAHMLAARGAKVVVNDLAATGSRRGFDAAADKVVSEIRRDGGVAVASYGSVAEVDTAGEIVATALDSFGRIDIVVNNAGILRDKTFAKMTMDEFDLVVRVHLLGSAYVTKAAWPHLLEQRYGRVVLTSSAQGLAGAFGQANYGAAKAGLVGLMKNLKNEGARSNVLVNAISPVAATPMTAGLFNDAMVSATQPERVAPAVGWLCSEACDVSGRILAAGGGHFAAIDIMKSKGVVLDDASEFTIESFAERLEQIFDFSDAKPYVRTLDDETRAQIGLL